jgi:tetratricopeptide (TPR) repeat protein
MKGQAIRFIGQDRVARLRLAAGLLQTATQLCPQKRQNWASRALILCQLGSSQNAVVCADAGLALYPDDVELGAIRILALIQLGAVDRALRDAQSLALAWPDSPKAGRVLLDALAAAGQRGAAVAAAASMTWIAADPRFSLEIPARRLVAEQRFEELVALCDTMLARRPGHTGATHYKAIALAHLGRHAQARETMQLGRFLSISLLPVPAGYTSRESFLESLAAEIRRNPTLVADPALKTTRNGLQTRQLRQPGDQAVATLLDLLEEAVADYRDQLAGQHGEFIAAAPDVAEILPWAVVYGEEGLQTSHCHPGGWLSGVFYVSAPRLAGEETYRGRLKVGDAGMPQLPWGIVDIEPVPGRLVLFPSFTPHSTEPPGIAGARISVAFDVVPADLNSPPADEPFNI